MPDPSIFEDFDDVALYGWPILILGCTALFLYLRSRPSLPQTDVATAERADPGPVQRQGMDEALLGNLQTSTTQSRTSRQPVGLTQMEMVSQWQQVVNTTQQMVRTPVVDNKTTAQILQRVNASESPAPSFFEGSFNDMVAHAKQHKKLIFILLHNDAHPDSKALLESTLCTEAVAEILQVNYVSLLWDNSQPRFTGLCAMLRLSFNPVTPTCIVLQAEQKQCRLLGKLEGPVPQMNMIQFLVDVFEKSQAIAQAKQKKIDDLQEGRLLRQQQDQEYALAQEADEKKLEQARRIVAEKAEKTRLFKAKQEALVDFQEESTALALSVAGEAITVGLRYSNGHRLQRKFKPDVLIESIYQLADSQLPEELIKEYLTVDDELEVTRQYQLVANHPRLELNDKTVQVQNLNLGDRVLFYVEQI
jgi:hypothetical protein